MIRIPEAILLKMGNEALAMMRENIRNGIDIEGNQYAYSTKPFVRPFGLPTQVAMNRLNAAVKRGDKTDDPSAPSVFTTKTNKLWVRFPNGYKQFKEIAYPTQAGTFLRITGQLLAGMNIIENTEWVVTIGWRDAGLSRRAAWLNLTGVGKGRRLWRFLGLRKTQQDELARKYANDFVQVISKTITDVIPKQ